MPKTVTQIIELHHAAPPKPEFGTACNGCGYCCAAEPCPVAHLFLFQFKGRCRALLWQNDMSRYVCGMVVCPDQYARLIPQRFRKGFGRYIATRISAGSGCDFVAEVVDTKI